MDAVVAPGLSRPLPDHARRRGFYVTRLTASQREARDRQRQPRPEDFTQLVGDISSAEIEARFQAHMAYLKRRPNRDDALVSATTASSLVNEHAIARGIRLR